jgi:hypothetical protein
MEFSITTPWSGSLALANARTVRPAILSTVSMNYAAVATWKNMRDSRTRCCSPIRERALAARQAADRATTEYARRAHERLAAVHMELALSHEDFARTLRFGGGGSEDD